MAAFDKDFVLLTEGEQVTRGLVLMDLLRSSTPSQVTKDHKLADVDWNVIVKRGFIEVVIPASRGAMKRSLSDGSLPRFEKQEMPWQKIVSDSKLDVSDASTNVSAEEEGIYADFIKNPTGEDFCSSSDGEADTDAFTAQTMPYQMDANGYWWMPMSYGDIDHTAMGWPMHCGGHSMWGVEDQGVDMDAEPQEWRTTVMIRNMPNNYTRALLLKLVDSMGFAGAYDFAYLPIDFQSQAGLGYAFINFVTVQDAQLCFDRLEGFSDWKVPSEKVCTIAWSSPTQGFEAHIERYQNSPVMHPSLSDEWKPILLQNGIRVEFPPPTKQLKSPKVRQQPASKNA